MVILKAEHLQSGYQGTPVLHDISFEVEEGKIVAILGSNGAGKTKIGRASCRERV